MRSSAFFFACALLLTAGLLTGQTDTLHLNYHHTQIKPHDTTVAKIEKWAKDLNGKHVDITVVAYYHKPEFKKFSDQRNEELFLILNRKARSLITIKQQVSRKGKDYQRTMVDIIYTPTLSEADKKAKAEAEKAEATKVAQAKKAEKEAAAKEQKGKSSDKSKSDKPAGKKDDGRDEVAQEEKSGKKSEKKEDKKTDKEEKEGDEDEADYGQASSRTINEGSSMSGEELKYLKGGKIVVAQTGNKTIDENLYLAAKNYWDFNSNIVRMPYDEAIKKGKENKKDTMSIISFIQVRTWFPEKKGPVTIKILRVGYALAVENNKGKLLMKQFVPKDKGQAPTVPYFAFAMSYLNNLCHIMDENKLSKSTKADPYFDLNAPMLKDRILYLGEHQMNKNLPREEIPQYYPYKYEIVSQQKWEQAILEKKDVAYVMVVPIPQSPKKFAHYIMDAKTGNTCLIDMGKKVSVGMGMGTPSFDPAQSGFVDKANLKRYAAGILDAEEDNKDRAESKAKKAEKEETKAAGKKEKEKTAGEEKKKDTKAKSGKNKKEESAAGTDEANEVEKELKEEVKEEDGKKKDKKSRSNKKDEEKAEETKGE